MTFLQALRSGTVLLMDGAMGTELLRRFGGSCLEALNLTRPDAVRSVHESYRRAGSRCFLTNTLQANVPALERAGRGEQLAEVAAAAVALARTAGGEGSFVLASIGPILSRAAGKEHGDEQSLTALARAFSGADALLLETWSSRHALVAARLLADLVGPPEVMPVLVSFTYLRAEDGRLRTYAGDTPEVLVEQAAEWGVAGLGVNCGRDIGMRDVVEILRRYRSATPLPLFARPNAGTPRQEGGRWVYPLTPGAMAEQVGELLEAGAAMVGGCCGTTPDHVAAIRPVVEAWNSRRQ